MSAQNPYMLYWISSSHSAQNPVLEKILSFGRLEEGWRYGEGGPASQDVILRAISIAEFGSLQYDETDAFPSVDGSVLVTFYREELCVEITIRPDDSYDATVEQGTGFDFEVLDEFWGISIGEVRKIITDYSTSRKWLSYASSTPESMTVDAVDFKAEYFHTPQMGQEYQFSIPNVREINPAVYAGTYGDTILI